MKIGYEELSIIFASGNEINISGDDFDELREWFENGDCGDEEDEVMGLDKAELGMEAYPEFGRGSQSL